MLAVNRFPLFPNPQSSARLRGDDRLELGQVPFWLRWKNRPFLPTRHPDSEKGKQGGLSSILSSGSRSDLSAQRSCPSARPALHRRGFGRFSLARKKLLCSKVPLSRAFFAISCWRITPICKPATVILARARARPLRHLAVPPRPQVSWRRERVPLPVCYQIRSATPRSSADFSASIQRRCHSLCLAHPNAPQCR